VSQTINGVTTHFVVDSSSSLSQVLSDGTNNYLYGDGLIAQDPGAGPEYFLTDGLGSVRQLADTSSQIILNRTYQPYGQELTTQGRESTLFGFTGEITDPSGLVYLRSRYYDPGNGRFLTQDTWPGRQTDPASYNAWLYANSNPINYADPSGKCYGPLSFLRKLPIEGEICEHLDQAMFIYLWPGSSSAQKWGASAYIGGWAFAHSGIIVGTGGLAVAGGQAAITWLTELYAASKFAQQLNQACQQLQTYLPSLQPPANVNNLWNQVMVATPKIGYLLNSPGKDGFIKLGYTAETLQAQLLTIGETVTPDLLSRVTEYGPRFEKVVEVVGPSGLMGRITTVWQVDNGTTILRFITAIPEVFK
jgi:RHS repeat-associated protein